MRGLNILSLILLLYKCAKQSNGYYILWEYDAVVEDDNYILLSEMLTNMDESSSILTIGGSIKIKLKHSGDNAFFDVFLVNQTQIDCFKNALLVQDFLQDCGIISDNNTSTFLNLNYFEVDFNTLLGHNNLLLDNTRYPERLGAYHSAPLVLKVQITLEMNALRAFYNATISLWLILSFVLIVGTTVIMIFYFKYRKSMKKFTKLQKYISKKNDGEINYLDLDIS